MQDVVRRIKVVVQLTLLRICRSCRVAVDKMELRVTFGRVLSKSPSHIIVGTANVVDVKDAVATTTT